MMIKSSPGLSGRAKIGHTIFIALIVLTMLAQTGCAGRNGGGGMLSWNLGVAPGSEVVSRVAYVLQKNQYQIYRQTNAPNIYIETQWEDRLLLSDEVEQGLEAVRTRFLIDARERSQRSGAGAGIYVVQLRAENIGRLKGEDEFQPLAPTDEFRKYASAIAEEIRTRLRDGMRVF
jgi:hypothetical protein